MKALIKLKVPFIGFCHCVQLWIDLFYDASKFQNDCSPPHLLWAEHHHLASDTRVWRQRGLRGRQLQLTGTLLFKNLDPRTTLVEAPQVPQGMTWDMRVFWKVMRAFPGCREGRSGTTAHSRASQRSIPRSQFLGDSTQESSSQQELGSAANNRKHYNNNNDLNQCFSNRYVHMKHPWILLKRRF